LLRAQIKRAKRRGIVYGRDHGHRDQSANEGALRKGSISGLPLSARSRRRIGRSSGGIFPQAAARDFGHFGRRFAGNSQTFQEALSRLPLFFWLSRLPFARRSGKVVYAAPTGAHRPGADRELSTGTGAINHGVGGTSSASQIFQRR